MSEFTWEQKADALNALTQVKLCIRGLGDWYVEHRSVEVKDGPFLRSMCGNGVTPEAAIEDHWRKFVTEIGSAYLVVNAYGNRRAVRWNGYMWQDYPE